jgi:hypothetical protein
MQFTKLLALGVCMGAAGAFATSLAPGTTVGPPLSDFTAAGINGAIVASAGPLAAGMGNLNGVFKLAVMTDALSGNLDFLYQFTTSPGSDAVEHITGSSFGWDGGLTADDVGYETTNAADVALFTVPTLTNGGSLTPVTADRSVGTGAVISFNWTGTPAWTGESYVLVIRTSAKTLQSGFANAIDGGTATVNGFAPAPEPSKIGLLLGGLFAAALFAARRFRVLQS